MQISNTIIFHHLPAFAQEKNNSPMNGRTIKKLKLAVAMILIAGSNIDPDLFIHHIYIHKVNQGISKIDR